MWVSDFKQRRQLSYNQRVFTRQIFKNKDECTCPLVADEHFPQQVYSSHQKSVLIKKW